MIYDVGCSLSYMAESDATFIFNLQVAQIPGQVVANERLRITPNAKQLVYSDAFTGNRYFRINVGPGEFAVEYDASVDVRYHHADPATIGETPVGNLPLEFFRYLLPSRYVPADRLASFAKAEFANVLPGFSRVNAICNWIYTHIAYEPGSSDELTIASETLLERVGVCRDFAHLGVAFCRALDIPARFVSCYALGLVPADFHAVFEAYLDGRWWLFDATRQADLNGIVRIGTGGDAAEVAFSSPYGSFTPTEMAVWIRKADGAAPNAIRTTDAISIGSHVTAALGLAN